MSLLSYSAQHMLLVKAWQSLGTSHTNRRLLPLPLMHLLLLWLTPPRRGLRSLCLFRYLSHLVTEVIALRRGADGRAISCLLSLFADAYKSKHHPYLKALSVCNDWLHAKGAYFASD